AGADARRLGQPRSRARVVRRAQEVRAAEHRVHVAAPLGGGERRRRVRLVPQDRLGPHLRAVSAAGRRYVTAAGADGHVANACAKRAGDATPWWSKTASASATRRAPADPGVSSPRRRRARAPITGSSNAE